jgi:tripartite ATP-independent transporter DctM subunit
MSLGPAIASGGLAMMIPPSALAVILAAIAKMSIGDILIGGIIPGLIMGALYIGYVIIRCILQPDLAPSYKVTKTPFSVKFNSFIKYLLPLGFIIFLVIGIIILGVATPTEAAALGCLGSFFLSALYGGLTLESVRKSIEGTVKISVMSLMIMSGAIAFSQILAYSGVSRGLLEFVVQLPFPPIVLLICMQIILLLLGTVMEQIAIMMVTLPIYMPIIKSLGFDPIWFGIIMLINLEMALTTPPFGLLLFVLKGVAPGDTTMGDIYRAGIPFLFCDAVAMILVIIFPSLVLWLPSLVR